MSHCAWKEDFLRGPKQHALLQRQRTMGARHIALGWNKTFCTHMWIDNMYAHVAQWGNFPRFSCFALESIHVRLQRLLRNSARVSLLNMISRLQCVVDNDTLHSNLRKQGWGVESRPMTKQMGVQR